jgi:hypothetical protein
MVALPSMLSHTLVAFTIEFDNEFERLMPHRTARHGGTPNAPWLVSMAMWSNFMRFVPEEGIALREIQGLTGKQWVERMAKWWGYVIVDKGVVRPSAGGRRAQEIWRPLAGAIEKRWEERFGHAKIDTLREALAAVVMQFDVGLPEYLPVLEYGLFTPTGRTAGVAVNLAALLSQVLLAFTLDFESESEVSLAICANVVRLVHDDGVRLRELPRVSGVSKEAIRTAVGWLEKRGLLKVEARLARLTAKGREAREDYLRRVGEVEKAWRVRYGDAAILELRESLEALPCDLLFRGMEPYPEGWRAVIPRPDVLPDFPMVLHRGGFPDGS